jgi:ATP-dependent Clp protease ATP-binding subunit ClpC
MTSNLGSDLIKRDSRLGFSTKQEDGKTFEQDYSRMHDKVMEEVKRFFRPEFLNRIDASVVFHALEQEHIIQIVDLMLDQVQKEVKEQEMTMVVTEAAKAKLAEEGYDPHMGARPLRRVIQSRIEDKLSDEILSGKYVAGDTIILDVNDDGEILSKASLETAEPAPAT